MEQWNISCIIQEKQTKNDLKLNPTIINVNLDIQILKGSISKNHASNEQIDGRE
jgi:hypothetical protein